MKDHKVSIAEAIGLLKDSAGEFVEVFNQGELSVEYYKPEQVDKQQPHDRNEVYVVASGRGTFYCNGKRTSFYAGDFLFVPAWMDHRFEHFSDDFATWVIFYGPVISRPGQQ